MKVLLILVDGMRPDSIRDIPQADRIMEKASYTMKARSVIPPVTLPCHVSLFHSVEPARHGTTTNTYAPQVRPIKGLCEVLAESKKKNAFFYTWEELRDLTRPGSLAYSCLISGRNTSYDGLEQRITNAAVKCLETKELDFMFLYLGMTDVQGHRHGWMSEPYMEAVRSSWERIGEAVSVLGEDDVVIITADHGGHDRDHGVDIPEDMTTPLIIMGKGFEAGKEIENANIIDIAPTIAKLLGVEPDPEWEGKSLI